MGNNVCCKQPIKPLEGFQHEKQTKESQEPTQKQKKQPKQFVKQNQQKKVANFKPQDIEEPELENESEMDRTIKKGHCKRGTMVDKELLSQLLSQQQDEDDDNNNNNQSQKNDQSDYHEDMEKAYESSIQVGAYSQRSSKVALTNLGDYENSKGIILLKEIN